MCSADGEVDAESSLLSEPVLATTVDEADVVGDAEGLALVDGSAVEDLVTLNDAVDLAEAEGENVPDGLGEALAVLRAGDSVLDFE